MLDPLDPGTLDLPGIPPAPVVPRRVSGKQARQAAGYQGPKERPSCRDCRHVGYVIQFPDSHAETLRPVCQRQAPGTGFAVHLGAICAHHVRNPRAGERF